MSRKNIEAGKASILRAETITAVVIGGYPKDINMGKVYLDSKNGTKDNKNSYIYIKCLKKF